MKIDIAINTTSGRRELSRPSPKLAAIGALILSLSVASCSSATPTQTDRQESILWNSILWNSILWNAYSGSVEGNAGLPGWGLSTDTFMSETRAGEYIRRALGTEHGPMFLSYLISCALPDGAFVEGKNERTGAIEKFHGGLGLCPEWENIDPTDPSSRVSNACQELVSACLLARVNSFGEPVQLSFRGLDKNGAPLMPLATVPGSPDQDHPEFLSTCADPDSGECGWSAAIGICQAGDDVKLRASGCAYEQRVRVCSGTAACEEREAIGGSSFICGEPAAFQCPASEDFTVMVSGSAFGPAVDVQGTNATYPVSELKLFDWREGGFYGNIFDTSRLRIDTKIHSNFSVSHYDRWNGNEIKPESFTPGTIDSKGRFIPEPFYNMNSCYDSQWQDDSAEYLRRVCVNPAGSARYQCAAAVVGPCNSGGPLEGVCKIDDTSPLVGDDDFDKCRDEDWTSWEHAITVFLNHPCDTLPRKGFCQ